MNSPDQAPGLADAKAAKARPASLAARRWTVALAGAVSLAVAMGIGRFAFTPLLPMMLQERAVDLAFASWLATTNYLGYLAGALLCTFQPWLWRSMPMLPPVSGPATVRAGLVATGLLTLGMAIPFPPLWPMLRFAAGVASALVFVYTSGWCLAQLARLEASALGSAVFAGPGAGIVASGLLASAMLAWNWPASSGWLIFGVLALALSALVWRIFQDPGATAEPPEGMPAAREVDPPASDGIRPGDHGPTEIGFLAAAYGIAGFGYIVTATFLPVIARQALPGSVWLDMFWPLFGLGVVIGALLATRLRASGDMRPRLVGAYLLQAAGIGIGVLRPTLGGFALGSLMLGVPFTAITFFAMQEVRRLRPLQAASFMGLLTAMYGIGQIVGPPLVAYVLARSSTTGAGFTVSLKIAMGALVFGALLYLWMVRAYPQSSLR